MLVSVLDLERLAPDGLRRFTRAEYEKMVALGLFEDEHVELLRGVLVTMTPQGPSHSDVLSRLNRILVVGVGERAVVRPQCPLAMPDDSMPEPDLAVVAPGSHHTVHPDAAFLVVEVAKTSVNKDRSVKAVLYAEGGVVDYWVVNLVAGVIEVYREPTAQGYRSVRTYQSGDELGPLAFPDIVVGVDEVLP